MRLSLEGVSLRYPGRLAPALDGVDFSIDSGERVALMGTSGSGKSTLLRVLAGLEVPDSGRVLIDGIDAIRASPMERGVGMVLQDAPLYEHLTVLENVAHPLRARGEPRAASRVRAEAMLERLRLSALRDERGDRISGGERRRVGLARALVARPALLLLDEPFASLDPPLRLELRDEVRRLSNDMDCACVHATHDGLEALSLGTRVTVLEAGAIVDDGPPARLWEAPRSPRSAVLLGSIPMNILTAEATAHAPPVTIGVRAEHVRVTMRADEASKRTTDDPGGWRAVGTIESIDHMGGVQMMTVRLDGGMLVRAVATPPRRCEPADDPERRGPTVGDSVTVSCDVRDVHRFP